MNWMDNEDAGDAGCYLAAERGAMEAEREAESRFRDWVAYLAVWDKWLRGGHVTKAFPSECEECGGPMRESNCHEGHYSWHCGCASA